MSFYSTFNEIMENAGPEFDAAYEQFDFATRINEGSTS